MHINITVSYPHQLQTTRRRGWVGGSAAEVAASPDTAARVGGWERRRGGRTHTASTANTASTLTCRNCHGSGTEGGIATGFAPAILSGGYSYRHASIPLFTDVNRRFTDVNTDGYRCKHGRLHGGYRCKHGRQAAAGRTRRARRLERPPRPHGRNGHPPQPRAAKRRPQRGRHAERREDEADARARRAFQSPRQTRPSRCRLPHVFTSVTDMFTIVT